jgi:hypothetical protein
MAETSEHAAPGELTSENAVSRRAFAFGIAACLAAFAPVVEYVLLKHRSASTAAAKGKRFKRRPDVPLYPAFAGKLVGIPNKAIHYVDITGRAYNGIQLFGPPTSRGRERPLEPTLAAVHEAVTSLTASSNARGSSVMSLSEIPWFFEIQALNLLKSGAPGANAAQAEQLLWTAIRADTILKKRSGNRPSYRLYDLLACLRHKTAPSTLAQLSEYIKATWPDDSVLVSRTDWKARESGWARHWKSGSLEWKRSVSTAVPPQQA